MRYAIIADIHAHLRALHAVLRDSVLPGCTHTACPGDLFGCGQEPKECVATVCNSVVRGATYSRFNIDPGNYYFVNPGSVGRPRDGGPRASDVVYDDT